MPLAPYLSIFLAQRVGRISEAPSGTVKYLANYYYQHFMLSNSLKVPEADGQINSFLDKNELELKDGSVPKAALE